MPAYEYLVGKGISLEYLSSVRHKRALFVQTLKNEVQQITTAAMQKTPMNATLHIVRE